jgi:UDP-3-O-[3-hydroxymyristoyl] glucosamine N-acyltransferase
VGVSLGDIACHLGARIEGEREGCRERVIDRVDTLERAQEGAISFFSNRRYRPALLATRASAVIIAEGDAVDCPCAALVVANPYVGYAVVARLLNPLPQAPRGVHPSAVVDASASVDPTACVGPNSVVEAGAVVGPNVVLGPACVIGEDVRIGADSRLAAQVTLCRGVRIGDRVTMHPGVVIGADGFGIANDDGIWIKIPQLGSVVIGNDVEIGANTCIDRGALEDTMISDGVKIDNHVQIGHNVRIGPHTAVAGCVAIAGSARIGARCTIGGSSSVSGHLEIADDVHLTGGTNVPNNIKAAGIYSSTLPLQSNLNWRKNMARVKQLDDIARRVRALENDTD